MVLHIICPIVQPNINLNIVTRSMQLPMSHNPMLPFVNVVVACLFVNTFIHPPEAVHTTPLLNYYMLIH